MNTQTLKELGIKQLKSHPTSEMKKVPYIFGFWVSIITTLASLGAVKPTLGCKVLPLETLLPNMEKKNLRVFSFPMMERNILKPFYNTVLCNNRVQNG